MLHICIYISLYIICMYVYMCLYVSYNGSGGRVHRWMRLSPKRSPDILFFPLCSPQLYGCCLKLFTVDKDLDLGKAPIRTRVGTCPGPCYPSAPSTLDDSTPPHPPIPSQHHVCKTYLHTHTYNTCNHILYYIYLDCSQVSR